MKFFEGVFDLLVKLPVAVVKDTVTLGGIITQKGESYTEEAVKKLDEDIKDED